MPDWTTWQTLGDWVGKMGLGGLVLWLIQRWFSKRDKLADRGQLLVDAARPELSPTGNAGGQYVVQINVENRGSGSAHTLRMGFTGVQEVATQDEVPPGQTRLTAGL